MIAAALLLAHQGGWDEVLLVLTPIAIFAALLFLANRRADTEVRRRAGAPDPDGGEGSAGATGAEPTATTEDDPPGAAPP